MKEKILSAIELSRFGILALAALGVAFSLDVSAADPLAPKAFYFATAASFVFALTFMRFWWGQQVALPKGPLVWAGAALLISLTLSHFLSPLSGAGEANWQAWVLFGALVLGLYDMLGDPARQRQVLRGLGALTLAIALLAVLQAMGLNLSAAARASRAAFGSRASGSLGNPNFLGGALVLLLPVLWWLRVTEPGARWRWVGNAGLGLALLAIGLSGSRAAWLGLAVEWLVIGHLYRRSDAEAGQRSRVLTLLVRLGLGALLLFIFLPGAWARLKSMASFSDQSVQFRLQTWEATVAMAEEQPLLGWGPGTFAAAYPEYRLPEAMAWQVQHSYEVTHPENWLMQLAVDGGAVGLVLFGAFVLLLGFSLRPHCRRWAEAEGDGHLAIALLTALFGSLACNLASLDLFLPSTFFFAAVLLALAMRRFSSPARLFGIVPEAYASWFMTAAAILFATVAPVNANLRWQASRQLQLGKAHSQAGRFDQAIPFYDKALLGDPANAEARYFLGASYQDRNQPGDLSKAEKAYGELRSTHPDYVLVHMKLAQLYDAQGKKDLALAEFARQSELDPYLAAAWEGQARLLYQAGKKDEAMKTLDQGLEMQPTDPGLLSNRGLVLVEAGNMDEGLRVFEAVLKAHPDKREARLNYAVSLLRAGRRSEAAAQAQLVLAARPNDPAATHVLRLAKGN